MEKTLPDRETLLHNIEKVYKHLLTEGKIIWAGEIIETKRQLKAKIEPIIGDITIHDYEKLLIEKIKLKEELEETKKELDRYRTITVEEFAIRLKDHPLVFGPSGHPYGEI